MRPGDDRARHRIVGELERLVGDAFAFDPERVPAQREPLDQTHQRARQCAGAERGGDVAPVQRDDHAMVAFARHRDFDQDVAPAHAVRAGGEGADPESVVPIVVVPAIVVVVPVVAGPREVRRAGNGEQEKHREDPPRASCHGMPPSKATESSCSKSRVKGRRVSGSPVKMDCDQGRWVPVLGHAVPNLDSPSARSRWETAGTVLALRARMSALVQDLKLALCSLRRAPTYTLAAVAALALAIGANTALFSLIEATILRPYPYPSPERLLLVRETSKSFDDSSVAYPNYRDWRAQTGGVFSGMAAFRRDSINLTGAGDPERLA